MSSPERSDGDVSPLSPSAAPIGRQLHDIVVPQLFVISTGLAALRRRGGVADDGLLDDLADTAARAMADLRAISRGQVTRPAGSLREVVDGLADATRSLSQLDGCRVEVRGEGEVELTAAMADDVAATAWEGVVNALRHGRAERVEVVVSAVPPAAGATAAAVLTVTVHDDGRWLPPTDPAATGLEGLRRRAAGWGGTVDVEPGPNGTLLRWQVPVPAGRSVIA